jgi:hypothetical protein
VLALIDKREHTVTELTDELFSFELTPAQRHFVMAEILAYLAYHEVRKQAVRERRPDGTFIWRSNQTTAEVGR